MGCCNEPVATLTGTPPDPSQHVNYARGMVLGVDDFTQEFSYLSGRDQWLARDAIGYGTLCGLRVWAESAGADGPRLHVSAGSALVPSGQLVCVPADQCAVINKWLAKAENAKTVARLLDPGAAITSPPMATPDIADGTVPLYLVLCYADCRTRPVPIPGAPCRSEDELMSPSRIADDFRLLLRDRPPMQLEGDAQRAFTRWLHDGIVVGPSSSPATGDDASWLEALRSAAQPWLQPASGTSSPPGASPSDDVMPELLPLGITVAPDQMGAFTRVALRFWVTELRPLWAARRCHVVMAEDQDCVLLARIELDVAWIGGSPAGAWQVAGSPATIRVDESARPVLGALRLMEEWDSASVAASASDGAPASPPMPVAPLALDFAPDDAEFIVATADPAIPMAQSLGALTTGLLRNTVAAARGTLSVAVAGTDYYAPAGTDVAVADGGTGSSTVPLDGQLLVGSAGKYVPVNLAGTANEIAVVSAPGTVTLSTPQPIAKTSTPEFAGLVTTGGVRVGVTTLNANATLTAAHHVLLCSNAITLTLPKSAGPDAGRLYVVRNIGAAAVTLKRQPGDKIEGVASNLVINPKNAMTIVADGASNWFVLTTVL